MLSLQPLITLCVDVSVIVLLIAIFIRIGRMRNHSVDPTQIKPLELSLKKTINDSMRVSDELSTRLDATMQELVRLLQRIEAKEKQLSASIARAEELADQLNDQPHGPFSGAGPYQTAIALIGQGMSDDDIYRQCRISREEIKLMRQLYQVRQHHGS
ncbi:MAG: DUF2802 domain-containing protein [Desulfobacterota bacterium]|nr:DUF2802 domain-containing protein [Thermodesulfobacteriota bacterium]